MRTCLYPGTFDPITMGHLDVIKRAARQYDRVVVAALTNSQKSPFFPLEERMSLIRECVRGMDCVEVISFSGLTVDCAKSLGACAIIRGLRAVMDFEYEFQLSSLNRMLAEEVETVFFMTDTQYMFISSSMVKEIGLLGGEYRAMVPPAAYARIEAAFADRRREPT